jgi:eukaryotic-like serine/threonine-protein kinase
MQSPALTGEVLDGKYLVDRMIGRGGMGAVYQAQHLGTGRPVALKVLLTSLVGNTEAVARFRREALAAGRLRHQNIVDVTDFGVARVGETDVAYLVMEYLEGSTLRKLIDSRGALPLDVAVSIVEQIAIAINAAHHAGIIHRDLKPENVWLVSDSRGGFIVRVLDFGIALVTASPDSPATTASGEPGDSTAATLALQANASPVADTASRDEVTWMESGDDAATAVRVPARASSALSTPSRSSVDTDRLTVAGSTLGTPLYMSPEQCRGTEAGPGSDIYSLGVITYELLEGRRPFEGNFLELVRQHIEVPPPPLTRTAPSAAAVVMRAISKKAEHRYETAQAFAGSLRAATEGAATTIRRSIALYTERFPEFSRLSFRAGRIPVIVALVMITASLLAGLFLRPVYAARGLIFTTALAPFLWTIATMMTNGMFAAAIERLRLRPLETVDASVIEADLRARIGLPPEAGYFRTFWRLAIVYLRCELRSEAGAGDIAFLVRFVEGLPLEEVPARTATLARSSRRAYTYVRVGIFAALFFVPVIEMAIIGFFAAPFTPMSRPLAMALAVSLLPVNAVLVNPIFSSALALLYFRARQANGEDVPLAALLAGRV